MNAFQRIAPSMVDIRSGTSASTVLRTGDCRSGSSENPARVCRLCVCRRQAWFRELTRRPAIWVPEDALAKFSAPEVPSERICCGRIRFLRLTTRSMGDPLVDAFGHCRSEEQDCGPGSFVAQMVSTAWSCSAFQASAAPSKRGGANVPVSRLRPRQELGGQ